MVNKSIIGATCGCVVTLITTTTKAALVDNGGGLIYDDVLNITWAQPDNIQRNWGEANTFASGLILGGVSGWRLPFISVAAGAGPFTGSPVDCDTASELACQDNELGYMFYHNLSGTRGVSIVDSGDPDLALFPSLTVLEKYFWSGTEVDSTSAWTLQFNAGGFISDPGQQIPQSQIAGNAHAWVVHEGNIVPVPAAVWLFGSGLIGLVGLARRKAQS